MVRRRVRKINKKQTMVAVKTAELGEMFELPAIYVNKFYISGGQDLSVRIIFAEESEAGEQSRAAIMLTHNGLLSFQNVINQVVEKMK